MPARLAALALTLALLATGMASARDCSLELITGDRTCRLAAVVDSDTEQTRIEIFEQVGINVEVGGAVTD